MRRDPLTLSFLIAWASLAWAALAVTPARGETLIERENRLPGTADWQLDRPARHREIEGYASATSVERGERIRLYVHTEAPGYRIDVFRIGWYGGAGARLMRGGIMRRGVRQPMPAADPETGLIECRWDDPYELAITPIDDPLDWPSGVYLAKLTALPGGLQSYIIFVVRDSARRADLLFQSSVTTFQAYNNWGGKSLYAANSSGAPARRVSFNRPYAMNANEAAASGNGAGDFLTTNSDTPGYPAASAGWEINMVRWLEREGYDVAYSTNVDTHARPELLRRHRVWLSVGHDEYWSWPMREHVEAARDAGVSLAFFSSNTCYWQIRLEPSPVTGEPDRTMIAYKEAAAEDPLARDGDPDNDRRITGLWRAAPVNRPEEMLLGVMYDREPVDADVVVADHAVWAGTGLQAGDRLMGLLGYEVDRRFGQGPRGVQVLARSAYRPGDRDAVAEMTLYRAASGALIFAAGTMQWSWGLDDFNAPALRTSRLSAAAQQATRNVLALLRAAAGDAVTAGER